MAKPLLHVVCAALASPADAEDVLRALRRFGAQDETLLLFADFLTADAEVLPDDASLLRRMQSGVMAMNACRPGQFLLLARRRVWNDAARRFLGREQPVSPRHVIVQLLETGKTDAAFVAATCAPSSLRGRCAAVLFSDLDLVCTPDTPARMLAALDHAKGGCICAPVREPRLYPETVFARLTRTCGFALSPWTAAHETLLSRQGLLPTENPTLYTTDALIASLHAPVASAPAAADCFFLRRTPRTLDAFLDGLRSAKQSTARLLVPLVQLALFFACAIEGLPLLAASALLPEALAAPHPRLLPGALLRTALLPMTAAISLDTLLHRLLACSKALRLHVPRALATPLAGMFAGAALLSLAVVRAQALPALLPVSLLWLALPLLLPALSSATLERIPLDAEEQAQLRTLAENAYFDAGQHAAPPLRMLAACAGCMLGVLEPDETARQVQALLEDAPQAETAAQQSAALVCAQYLRERMADCDAALRELPAQLERFVLAQPLPESGGRLGAFLRAARSRKAVSLTPSQDGGDPLDALFLPLGPAKSTPQHTLTLPLTHPHTFLRHALLAPDVDSERLDPLPRFLALSAAALGHPFCSLLMRSPVAAPYAPLLYA